MPASAHAVPLAEILPWRELYRQEMACQILHDSIHARPGWSVEYLLRLGDLPVGYGSLAVAGPWKDRPTLYEFHVAPEHRTRAFDLFAALRTASGAVRIETQSNAPLLFVMLHAFGRDVTSEKIVFQDRVATSLTAPGAKFRRATPDDKARIFSHHHEPVGDWIVECDGAVAATGGILWHYNRPYGDLYYEVAEPFRRRGLGAWLTQELKRACYEQGGVPTARCSPDNVASRATLQKAGFVPCAHRLVGTLSPQAPTS